MASNKYNYKLLEELDDSLKCCFCLELIKGQPMQHGASGCGRLFCQACIEQYGDNPCPICRGQHPRYFEDVKSLRDIKALGVKCDNADKGCQWKGTVDTLEKHMAVCGLTVVGCPNKCKVGGKNVSFLRKDILNHVTNDCPMRKYTCKFCGKESTYVKITNEHDQVCAKKQVKCPNPGCYEMIEQSQADAHISNKCLHTVVRCKYNHIGCRTKAKRKVIKQHEADCEAHFKCLLEKVADMEPTYKAEVIVLRRKITELEDQLQMQSEIIATLRKEKEEMVTVQQKIFQLESQLKTHSDITAALKEEMDATKGINVIHVTGYTLKKTNNAMFKSSPFYTIPSGYKMCLVVFANGNDTGERTHISVYIELLEVAYRLKWPFQGYIKFELLNQIANENHRFRLIKTSDYDSKLGKVGGKFGCSRFIPQEQLQHDTRKNIKFLVDDTLHFRVTVQEERKDKPWIKPLE